MDRVILGTVLKLSLPVVPYSVLVKTSLQLAKQNALLESVTGITKTSKRFYEVNVAYSPREQFDVFAY